MTEPNQHGVYTPLAIFELARCGNAYASVRVAQCRDGRFRFGLALQHSYGGQSFPVADEGEGFASVGEAREAGTADHLTFLRRTHDERASVQAELRSLQQQIEAGSRQLSLF